MVLGVLQVLGTAESKKEEIGGFLYADDSLRNVSDGIILLKEGFLCQWFMSLAGDCGGHKHSPKPPDGLWSITGCDTCQQCPVEPSPTDDLGHGAVTIACKQSYGTESLFGLFWAMFAILVTLQ